MVLDINDSYLDAQTFKNEYYKVYVIETPAVIFSIEKNEKIFRFTK